MGIAWDYRTHKKMSWTTRLTESKNSTHSPYIYERIICEAFEINKLRTINEKDKTITVLNGGYDDYNTANS